MTTPLIAPHLSTVQTGCLTNRLVTSSDISELYLTALPIPGLSLPEQARRMFDQIAETLKAHDAWILEERVFCTAGASEILNHARCAAYGAREDGVPASWLTVPAETTGAVLGVQIHAVTGCRPEILAHERRPAGRVIRHKNYSLIALAALSAPEERTPEKQFARTLEKAENLLRKSGGDFRSVARTWWWLGDILSHYGDFNRVRRSFFSRAGILSNLSSRPMGDAQLVPASTGIGVFGASAPDCTLDLIALVGDPGRVQRFPVSGNQRSPCAYGSAFSRAARLDALAGHTLYVSGTAAIDAAGETCHVGDTKAQIEDTLENVAAVLREYECDYPDVAQAIAYCKTPEVERLWRQQAQNYNFPVVTVLADVCRDDLLFELEVTAEK